MKISTTEKVSKESNKVIVQKAPHYQSILIKGKQGKLEFEAWEIISSIIKHVGADQKTSWALGDSLKYILRCGKKFGDKMAKTQTEKAAQDLRKAAYYINKAADFLEEPDNE